MSVLESTGHVAPRSALHYRPIESEASQAGQPVAQRASRVRPRRADTEDEVSEWQRGEDEDANASNGGRRITASPEKPSRVSHTRVKRGLGGRAHPLLYLGLGMIAMFTLWTLLILAVNWWSTTMDDIHYGRPRTFQTDAFVGHIEAGTPSHFIALNYNGRIEIIEFPGGDGAHARIYLGPQLYGAGDNLVPVTLSFVDVNNNRKPAMVVHFRASRIIFINDQGGFRSPTPQEQQVVEQYLASHGQ